MPVNDKFTRRCEEICEASGRVASELDCSMLVEWLLESMGWDPHDLRRVHRQYPNPCKTDIVLIARDGRVVAVVEVKQEWASIAGGGPFEGGVDANDEPRNAIAQLSTYAKVLSANQRLHPEAIVVAATGDKYVFAGAVRLAEDRRRADADGAGRNRSVGLFEPIVADLREPESAEALRKRFEYLATL